MNRFEINLVAFFLFLTLTLPVFALLKQHYGGNAKIAEDLTPVLTQFVLFAEISDHLKSDYPFPFSIQENELTIDLSSLSADKITELEQAVDSLRDESNSCHWILDYPYFHHQHPNSISVNGTKLVLRTSEPEFLSTIAQSSCFIPKNISYLMPFSKTQFGFEANQKCIAGRPFLDSISPVAIDPVNPYLAFKLNEVDAFIVPEEKFRQVVSDEQIKILPGPRFYLYLQSENITPEQMTSLTSHIQARELSSAVFNDHAELYLPEKNLPQAAVWTTPIYMKIPEGTPFRFIGDRLKVQLENAGFVISSGILPQNSPTLELSVEQLNENDLDLFRYRLLKEKTPVAAETSWFEAWDGLEAEGKIVPLMLYETRVAVRKHFVDVRSGAGGMPDFSNAWIRPAP